MSIKLTTEIALANEKIISAHKRLDDMQKDINTLEESRHKHAVLIQGHDGLLKMQNIMITRVETAVDKLGTITEEASKGFREEASKLRGSIDKMWWLSAGGMAVGTTLLAAIIYLGKDIFKLW